MERYSNHASGQRWTVQNSNTGEDPSMLVKNIVVLRHELHPHLPMEKFNDSYNYFDIKHPANRCCVSIVSEFSDIFIFLSYSVKIWIFILISSIYSRIL